MTVRGIEYEHVDACGDERVRAVERVRADADRRADAQPPLRVLRRVRVLEPLRDVLDRDQALQASVCVDDRQLLDLVPVEDPLGLGERGADRRRDQVGARHQRTDRLRCVVLEAEVAVGQDAHQHPVRVRDRHPRDAVVRHQLERLGDRRVRGERHRLDDHPRLRALDLVDLGDLVLDRQVAVDDPDPADACERDCEPSLGDRVHRRRDDRDRELDLARQPGARGDVVREDLGFGGHEQDVVERKPLAGELLLEREEPLDLDPT